MDHYDFEKTKGKQLRTRAELRDTGDEFALVGYASVFNTWSRNLGGFREIIKPGTFARSIQQGADVKCLFNHAPDNVLGRTQSGTCTIGEDSHGLRFRCQLNKNSQAHRDLYEAVKRGDINECSFAFTVPAGGQSWANGKDPETGEDCAMRTLSDVDLIDVSVVTYPAYPGTDAGARNQRSAPDYGPAVGPASERFKIDTIIKLATMGGRRYVADIRKSPYPTPYDYAALDLLYQNAMELCSAAFACSDLIDDALDQWDGDESDSARAKCGKGDKYPYNQPGDDAPHNFRGKHKESHAALSGAIEAFAHTRAALWRCMGKK